MEFIIKNLEIITAVAGGLCTGGVIFLTKNKTRANDLTQLYIKHKKHNDNISKSSKTIF